MKPHIKVIQRNGVDVFVTSSVKMKEVKRKSVVASSLVTEAQRRLNRYYAGMANDIDVNRRFSHANVTIWNGSGK